MTLSILFSFHDGRFKLLSICQDGGGEGGMDLGMGVAPWSGLVLWPLLHRFVTCL